MKLRALFNLIEDSQEICQLFGKVETSEQMVSTLERLKKQGSTELLELVDSLRLSVEAALEDTIELGGTIGGDDDFNLDEEGDEGGDLLGKLGEEEPNSPEKSETQEK